MKIKANGTFSFDRLSTIPTQPTKPGVLSCKAFWREILLDTWIAGRNEFVIFGYRRFRKDRNVYGKGTWFFRQIRFAKKTLTLHFPFECLSLTKKLSIKPMLQEIKSGALDQLELETMKHHNKNRQESNAPVKS